MKEFEIFNRISFIMLVSAQETEFVWQSTFPYTHTH